MNLMLLGAIAMACVTASLLFLRFWKSTGDRFFLFFAFSFAIEGGNRLLFGIVDNPSEQEPTFYLLRLMSFLIILFAIVNKNWNRSKQ